MEKKTDEKTIDYFERPNVFWYILIVPSIIYVAILAYVPRLIPFDSLGPLGQFSLYLNKHHEIIPILIIWATLTAHVLEAIYAVRKATQLNISLISRNRWFFQTLLLGFPSLRLIIRYSRKHRKYY